MKHIIIFSYIFTILIGASAFTIEFITCRLSNHNRYKDIGLFMASLLIMNGFDFVVYYNDNIMRVINRVTLVSLGDCMIAILVFLWFSACNCFIEGNWTRKVVEATKYYGIIYCLIWVASFLFFDKTQWLRVLIDVPLICLLISGAVITVVEGNTKEPKNDEMLYLVVVNTFMIVNYSSYLIQESGLYSNISFISMNNLNLTVFYWLVINTANVLFFYSHEYIVSKEAGNIETEEEKLENSVIQIGNTYKLTKRELELVKEIYNGKTNGEIAEELFISESTVKAHIYNIFKKLNVKNRVDVICIIREQGSSK